MQPELDPLFAKALRLLQSKEPQSIQQLNNLVQEQRDKILGIVSKKVRLLVLTLGERNHFHLMRATNKVGRVVALKSGNIIERF